LRKSEVYSSWKDLTLSRKYIFFAIFYGLSSLIIPLTSQYLVNNLALAGILSNTITFILILALTLFFSQIFRFSQVILGEYLQREIFLQEVVHWKTNGLNEKAPYFFEVFSLMKSFSKSFSYLIELGLLVLFGLLLIISFHPFFIILGLIICSSIWWVFSTWRPAIRASLVESDQKYKMFYQILDDHYFENEDISGYIHKRDAHFHFIRKNTINVAVTIVISQIILIGAGIYLVELDELSVGQLVSAEITLSGILGSLLKLPKSLEALYDFETSKIKLKQALGEKYANE
jgi:ABC-type bacteriocin/lantibiotic exporter with double-glycine peptidase domain